jgi:hypothetical protein
VTERVTFEDAAGLPGSPAQVVARIGPCSLGTVDTVYEFAGEQDAIVGDAIGYGDLAAWTRRGSRYGRQTCYAVPAEIDTAGAIGSVTKTGDGPTITATAVPASGDQIEGPWFSFPDLRIKVTTSGAPGEGRAQLLLDGLTPGDETIDIPPLLPASVTGTVDLTTLSSGVLSALNTKTFIANPDGDGAKTTTFSGVADYEDIIEQVGDSMQDAATVLGTEALTAYTPGDINTKTFLATLTVEGVETAISVTFAAVASLANIATQIAAASGITSALESGDFISVTTDAKGADVSLVIGNGTANADLGFTNGQTVTGETHGTAELVGGKYLRITATVEGSTGSLVIGNGTANADLGFTNGTEATGVNSTYDIPGTGVRLTFPAGDYEEDTTYDIPVVGPRISIAGMQAAAAALRAEGVQFAILHVVHEPADGLDLLAWQSALETIRLAWAQAEDNPIFVKWVIGSPLGDPGVAGDLTASRVAWAANDQNVKTNLANTQIANKFNTIVHGDTFVEFLEYSGRHRVQLAGPYVEECAGYPLNVNPGLGSKGPLRAAYLKGIDGTPARTEAQSTVPMQDHGFSVLRDDQSTPYIRAGRTRAPSTSQLTGEHTARAALECARVTRNRAFFYSNSTPVLGANGQLAPIDKANIEGAFNRDLEEEIVKKGYASSARAIVIGLVTVGGTDRLHVKVVFQRLANVTGVDITIITTNRLDIVEGIANAA